VGSGRGVWHTPVHLDLRERRLRQRPLRERTLPSMEEGGLTPRIDSVVGARSRIVGRRVRIGRLQRRIPELIATSSEQ